MPTLPYVTHFINATLLIMFISTITNNGKRYVHGRTYRLGTKMPYEWTSGNSPFKTHPEKHCIKNSIIHSSLRCTPLTVNAVYRHGIRFPSKKYITTVNEAWKRIHNFINDEYVKQWVNKFTEENDKKIADKGIQEMYGLGYRFGQSYCDLLSNSGLSQENIQFVSSSKSRSKQSAMSFKHGLYTSRGWEDNSWYMQSVIENDDLLRYFKGCSFYQHHLNTAEKNGIKPHRKEFDLFMNGSEMNSVNIEVSSFLKIPQNMLTNEEIHSLYYIAAFDMLHHDDYRLISIFNDRHLNILEYLEDLKHYWKKAYGYKINYLITCGLIREIHNSFLSIIDSFNNKKSYKVAVLQFGHAETIMPLTAALNLFKDELPLRADNYDQHHNRSFRTSFISPFSGNIAFVLHYCDKGRLDIDHFYVQTILHERPVILPGCEHELCPFITWTDKIQYLLDIDFTTYCSVPKDEL